MCDHHSFCDYVDELVTLPAAGAAQNGDFHKIALFPSNFAPQARPNTPLAVVAYLNIVFQNLNQEYFKNFRNK